MSKSPPGRVSLSEILSGKFLVRRYGVRAATAIITLSNFTIVAAIITIAAIQTGFPILPGVVVTVLIHLVLLPQTYQTNRTIADLDDTRDALYHQSITDELTGAYSRRFFMEELQRAIAAARTRGTPLAVIQFDIDDFKRINDTHGHHVGDSVLRQVSLLCRGSARESDVFARTGGEEFAFLLRSTAAPEAMRFAERLRATIEASSTPSAEGDIRVSVSVGVSTYSGQDHIDEILRAGDQAMYRAKALGKNCVVLAEPARNQGAP